jgi:hypothetical protein
MAYGIRREPDEMEKSIVVLVLALPSFIRSVPNENNQGDRPLMA